MKPLLHVSFVLTIVIGLVAATAGLMASPVLAAPSDFPEPAALERDVSFWKRIYSEVGTDAGLIHDNRDLGVVYETCKIPTGLSPSAQERHTEARKKHFSAVLLTLAKGNRKSLSKEERRILALFESGVSNATLIESASRVRFQLGQANKFRAGIIRSGAYKPHILKNLREMGLPLEIAHLPHVESSYTPSIYSRVGAAGLWQFTRSTGARFMQVDHIVDERLDPYQASIAAGRLLEQNLRVTGSWPLAITAYNHGASGMRRAAQQLGTKDITRIVRDYRSRTFGFASRNFYVEFLAANAVATEADRYFGPLTLDKPIAYETAELPYFAKASQLAKALGIPKSTLEEANPALRAPIWQESKYIPKGFEVRVPRAALPKPLHQSIAALPQKHRYAHQTRDSTYVVQRGDTLSTIARRHHVSQNELVALNGLRSQHRIRIGQKIKLPTDAASPATVKAAYKPVKVAPKQAPVTIADLPAALPEDGHYTVASGDNLTVIANRFGITVAKLVEMNKLRSRNRIAPGQRLRVASGTGSIELAQRSKKGPKAAPNAASKNHPDADASLTPARSAKLDPSPADLADTPSIAEPGLEIAGTDESPTDPSPGLLADPSDYTVASNGTIRVQSGETLGHYAEWLGLRTSRLRDINGLRFGEPVVEQQRLRLDFSQVRPEVFEGIRIEYHRALQEEFFAEWEIEETLIHRVGSGDTLWILSTRRFDVPIWLLRQYNPDVNLDALSAGTPLTVPKLRQRESETSRNESVARNASAG